MDRDVFSDALRRTALLADGRQQDGAGGAMKTGQQRSVRFFLLSTIEEFPALYEAYYNDHLPYRDFLIRMNSGLEYYVFQTSSNENVVRGKEEWLFYNSSADDNPIEAYKGMGLFTQQELEQIGNNLLTTRDAVRKRNRVCSLYCP